MSDSDMPNGQRSSTDSSRNLISRFEVRPVERNLAPEALDTAATHLHTALKDTDRRDEPWKAVLVLAPIMIAAVASLFYSLATNNHILFESLPGSDFALLEATQRYDPWAIDVIAVVLHVGIIALPVAGVIKLGRFSGGSEENHRLFYRLVTAPGEGVKQIVDVDSTRAHGVQEALKTSYSGDVEIHEVEPFGPDGLEAALRRQPSPTQVQTITFHPDSKGDKFLVDADRTPAKKLAGDADIGLVVDEVAQALNQLDAVCTYDVLVTPLADKTERIDNLVDIDRQGLSRRWLVRKLQKFFPISETKRDRLEAHTNQKRANKIEQLRNATGSTQFEVSIRVSVYGEVDRGVSGEFQQICNQLDLCTSGYMTVDSTREKLERGDPWERAEDRLPINSQGRFSDSTTYIADKSEIWNYLLLPGTGKTKGIPRSDAPFNNLPPHELEQHMADWTPDTEDLDDIDFGDES